MTRAEIVEADLERRLRALAHDSMMGRAAGTRGNFMGTSYIAREAERLGLEPAGEGGTWFQTVPMERRGLDPQTRLGTLTVAAGEILPLAPPFFPAALSYDVSNAEVVFGGWGTLEPARAEGRVVVLASTSPAQPALAEWMQKYSGAAALVIAILDGVPPATRQILAEPQVGIVAEPSAAPSLPVILVTRAGAETLLGRGFEGAEAGASASARVSGRGGQQASAVEAPARNVIAVIPGTDASRRGEYVVIGAHNDHVGTTRVLDHDSVRAHNLVMRMEGAQSPETAPNAEQQARIDAMRRTLSADGARPDSIHNGADDDASGTAALLELAEYFQANRPRRSLLFVWHTGEELGMLGSTHFTDNPTRPLESMVAQINVDMVGRGMEEDLAGGGLHYLQLIGSRRLSTQLGDLVEEVNRAGGHGFRFDYSLDAEGHPQNIYCRSDHASYARFGIPVVFMTTGVHPEYHQVTDEVEYISFPKMRRVTSFIAAVAESVANADARPHVDGPKPDPNAPCKQ